MWFLWLTSSFIFTYFFPPTPSLPFTPIPLPHVASATLYAILCFPPCSHINNYIKHLHTYMCFLSLLYKKNSIRSHVKVRILHFSHVIIIRCWHSWVLSFSYYFAYYYLVDCSMTYWMILLQTMLWEHPSLCSYGHDMARSMMVF